MIIYRITRTATRKRVRVRLIPFISPSHSTVYSQVFAFLRKASCESFFLPPVEPGGFPRLKAPIKSLLSQRDRRLFPFLLQLFQFYQKPCKIVRQRALELKISAISRMYKADQPSMKALPFQAQIRLLGPINRVPRHRMA